MRNELKELLSSVNNRLEELSLNSYKDYITNHDGNLQSYLKSDSSYVKANSEGNIKESLKKGKILYEKLLS